MPSKKNQVETDEVRCKASKKVIDEADRLRKKTELEQLLKEEEESNDRLEAIRLQKSPKIRSKKSPEIPPAPLPECLQTEEQMEERRKQINKIKSSKKRAKELSRQKKLEAEMAKSKKLSSSLSNSPLKQNLNHANFFDDVENQVEDEINSEEEEEEEEEDHVDEQNEASSDEENDGDFVLITNSLECVSINTDDFNSPASVAEAETECIPPPLTLDEASKKKKNKNKGKNNDDIEDKSIDNNKGKKKQKPMSEKKLAKEALKAAYASFEAKMLPNIKEENPKLRHREHRDIAAAMWLRSPENPDHPNHKLFLAHEQKNIM